ncbi:MAG TPA: hypothetical protein VF192_01350 [Longimicrobiales bacterium]
MDDGALLEFYYEDSSPGEALGRAARRLRSGGALYLGAGIGVERVSKGEKGESFTVLTGSGTEKVDGPLTAVSKAFTLAGQKKLAGTPGGKASIADPAVAARLNELDDAEAGAKRNLREYEDRLRRTRKNPAWGAGNSGDEDRWEVRRIAELKGQLSRVRAERARLLSGGNLEEEDRMWAAEAALREEAAKGMGGHATVGPRERKKLAPLVKHYMSKAHPHGACVRDQMKHGLSRDHANRRCAVLKDIGHGGDTSWRKNRRKVREAVAEAQARIAQVDAHLGEGAAKALAERYGTIGDPDLEALAEGLFGDFGTLLICGALSE